MPERDCHHTTRQATRRSRPRRSRPAPRPRTTGRYLAGLRVLSGTVGQPTDRVMKKSCRFYGSSIAAVAERAAIRCSWAWSPSPPLPATSVTSPNPRFELQQGGDSDRAITPGRLNCWPFECGYGARTLGGPSAGLRLSRFLAVDSGQTHNLMSHRPTEPHGLFSLDLIHSEPRMAIEDPIVG